MRRHAKASFAASTLGSGIRRGRLGLVCLCVLGLAAFLGSSAPSAGAQGCSNEAFRQGPSAGLPDCRAYEMVSPADMEGYEVTGGPFDVSIGPGIAPTVAANGDAAAFATFGAFGETTSSGVSSAFLSRRGASAWSTEEISPPSGVYLALHIFALEGFTEGFDKAVQTGFWEPPLTSDAVLGSEQLYLRNLANGSFRLVSPGVSPESGETDLRARGMSADAGHVVIVAPEELAGDCGAPAVADYLCDWNAATGAISLVGRAPVTNEVLTGSEVTLAGPNYRRSVSVDGSRIFFEGGGEGCGVCVRINGAVTQVVSETGTFWSASSNGSLAYVTEGEDLKRYDVNADELGPSLAGEVQGVLGTSADGSRVYFVSKEEIGGEGAPGENNLYLWTQGVGFQFIATGITLASNWSTSGMFGPTSRVTPDGMHVAFTADNSLTEYLHPGVTEAYLYSAVTGTLVCASCNPIAAPTTGADITGGTQYDIARLSRNLSDDGGRLFFVTDEALVPQDSNGLQDVYEYDAASGAVALISPGTDTRDTKLSDASASGNDVLFRSRQQLVGVDEGGALDVYDARVGGGLASQNPPPPVPPCTGDGCRGESSTPSLTGAASAGFVGKGNLSQKQNCSKLGREAKKLSNRAKRLRKNAKTAKRNGKSGVAKKRNKKANRLAKQARNKSKSAKKCRQRNRGASK